MFYFYIFTKILINLIKISPYDQKIIHKHRFSHVMLS